MKSKENSNEIKNTRAAELQNAIVLGQTVEIRRDK